MNALCPACRRPYSDEDIQFKPVSPEEIQRIKNQKKRNEKEKKDTDQTNRKQLANVRVVQKNLVYVLGLPPKLCTEDVLKSNDYFGQYGKITKVVINRKTNNQNTGVYITYLKKDDAQRAIEQVDGTDFEGKVLRATFGTTKYCSYYLKGQPCQNIGCQFLHESGEDAESFLKEESRLYKYVMLISQRGEKPMKLAFASNKDSNDPSIPNNVAWGKTVPISLRNSQQFPSLGGSSSQSTDNHGPLEFKGQEKHSDNDLLGSSALDDSAAFVPDLTDPLTLRKAGLLLLPRYNGLFDPFGSDRLLKTLMALVSEKGPDVANSPPLTQSHSTNELDLPDSGGRKSRYERLFDSSSTIAEQTNVANSKQEQKSAEQVNRNGDPPPSDQQISFFQNHQVRNNYLQADLKQQGSHFLSDLPPANREDMVKAPQPSRLL